MSVDPAILVIPYGEDPLRHLASLLLERHRAQLPDLSRQVVLFPHTSAVPRFRQILREQATQYGCTALLPPYTGALASWAGRFADASPRCLSATTREILLLDLLNDFPEWRDQYGTWPLVDSLMALFDELTLHQCPLPDDSAGFLQQISGSVGTGIDEFSPFDNEARLVHALWVAWHEFLKKHAYQDQTIRTIDGLACSLSQIPTDTRIYLAGFVDFTRAEIQWFKAMRDKRRITLLLHGQPGGKIGELDTAIAGLLHETATVPEISSSYDAFTVFLDRTYARAEGNLLDRARQQATESPASPAHGRLIIHEAADAESEARAIDLQVRRWLVQGLRDIGIITHDRKLARRARALLERANVGLQDAGGWALSTTSAATALARWLECIEQHFAHAPLLDLLKSPFVRLGFSRAELDRLVPPFEQLVVRARNISSGLDNYRFGLERARGNLEANFGDDVARGLTQMLDRLSNAAAALKDMMHGQSCTAMDFIAALQESLNKLGLSGSFENDEAGRELLALQEEMRVAATHDGLRLSWTGFQQWLMRNMEQRRFRPPMKGRGVELMGFTESRLYRYDALIIAGALSEHLPGQLGAPPYFNDGVRADMGLPSLTRRYDLLFHDFRRLLEAAPRVVISLHRENEGERLVPSPWVERLRAFHLLAYGRSLDDPELEWLVHQPDTVIVNRDAPLPAPVKPPAARLPSAMVPSVITATDHQRLMDCPYQFFCACGLKLAPEKEVRDEIEKADYGSHLHRILQAFHAGVPGLPGPWQKPFNDETRSEAEALLREISHAVFAGDLRRRFIARGWLYRWEECIPAYLDWEQRLAPRWQRQASEVKKQLDIHEGDVHVSLAGRIDRLDHGVDGLRIIDYKTGAVPKHDLVTSGEKIQLPFYILLLEEERVAQALFLSLQDGEVTEKNILEGEALTVLRSAVRERLIHLKRRLDDETPLPAWGDAETCELCDMEGLCRREMWFEPNGDAR